MKQECCFGCGLWFDATILVLTRSDGYQPHCQACADKATPFSVGRARCYACGDSIAKAVMVHDDDDGNQMHCIPCAAAVRLGKFSRHQVSDDQMSDPTTRND